MSLRTAPSWAGVGIVLASVALFLALRLILPGPVPVDGNALLHAAPPADKGYVVEPVAREPGYAELIIRQKADPEKEATLLIEDGVHDPKWRERFAGKKTEIADFPADPAAPENGEAAVLVRNRFVATLSSDELSAEERTRWLADCDLERLARLGGPPVLYLVTVLVAGVALLLVFILNLRIQPFVALLLVSILVGIAAGMPVLELSESIIKGMGGGLGFLATVIGLGAIFGQLIQASGGAHTLAHSLLRIFGEKRAPWAMMLVGFLISIPVFLDVGLVILAPILYALTRDSKKSLLVFGLPLLAGMAVTHSFIPPTPGPILVAQNLGADLGAVIVAGTIIGLPTAMVAAWVSCRLAARFHVEVPEHMETRLRERPETQPRSRPTLGLVLAIMTVPVLLILMGTILKVLVDLDRLDNHGFVQAIRFLGEPVVALLVATLLSLYLLGTRHGFQREELSELSTRALGPAGIIILVTGAGSVFKQILVDSGVGVAIAETLGSTSIPTMVLAYLFAVIVRVSQGSATVAMIMASTLMVPLLASDLGMGQKALHVIAIAAGATTASHVNDSGFWMVSRYFGMSEKLTLRTWTVVTIVISVTGFALAMAASLIVPGRV
ncbi:MAG TPA: gluconate:H+ symporter [Verrucomicrobiales bacterium]|nr:gluconate:H+ symporter [Verrucomicrobiales bacterium]